MSKHKILSFIKSSIRIGGSVAALLVLNQPPVALACFICTQALAEVVGIIEEVDEK